MRYAINGETLEGIASAVRAKRHIEDKLTPERIRQEIAALRIGIPIDITLRINPQTGEWERPAEWPNLDAIDIPEGFEGVYLTYDNTAGCDFRWAGFHCDLTDGSPYLIECGHLDNGAFVADRTVTASKNTYIEDYYGDATTDYVVYRISPGGDNSHFIRFGFGRISAGRTGRALQCDYYRQRCLERRGKLPYVTSLGSSNANYGYGCSYMERDSVLVGRKSRVTTLNSAWSGCYSLQSLDLSGWDTTGWAVTNLSFTDANRLPASQIVRLFEGLAQTTKAMTLKFGAQRYKLTPEQIAIATAKGYTIA